MNEITGLGSSATTGGQTANRFQEMSSEDFIRIIFTELTNQDPLEPQDSGALLDQLNSIRSIESDIQLTEKLDALVTQNALASAGNLVGKLVRGLTESHDRVEGVVVSVRRSGDAISVELDTGAQVPFDEIDYVGFDSDRLREFAS